MRTRTRSAGATLRTVVLFVLHMLDGAQLVIPFGLLFAFVVSSYR